MRGFDLPLEQIEAGREAEEDRLSRLCPNCGKDEVGTYTADDSFDYGVGVSVRLVAKDVLFFRCMACGQEFTGEDGETKRMAEVTKLLNAAPVLKTENERLRAGLQLIATDKHRLMNETARQTAASILAGKPIS